MDMRKGSELEISEFGFSYKNWLSVGVDVLIKGGGVVLRLGLGFLSWLDLVCFWLRFFDFDNCLVIGGVMRCGFGFD